MSCPGVISSGPPGFQDLGPVAAGLVGQAYGFAQSAQGTASSLMGQITSMANSIQVDAIEAPQISSPSLYIGAVPSGPSKPQIPTSFGSAPVLESLGAVTLPTFANAPTPEIDYPTVDLSVPLPAALANQVPGAPDMPYVDVPDAPVVALPPLPSLAAITVPDLPVIDLPQLEAMLGDAPLAPDTTFTFAESAYTSDLLDGYRGVLLAWVQGQSTGLEPQVEEAMWNRARDREAALYGSALNQIAKDYAARGFPIPPGAAVALAHQAIQKAREGSSSINRDIAIKQAELEQQNRQFALSEARQIEMGLMNYASQIAQRAFEAARYTVEAAIAVYGARVQQYNGEVQAFTARAQVYRDRIAGELAKLELYKGQIEGQRLVSTLNEQAVAIYKARLEGVQTMIATYESQVRAAGVKADIAKQAIEIFKAQVDAYGEQVRAKASEYDAYATRVKAEVSKYELPRVQAEVFKAATEGYAANVRGQVEAKNLEAKLKQELPVELFRTKVEAFNSEVQAVSSQIRALTELYQADATVYDARVRGVVGIAGAQADLAKAGVDAGIANAQATIEANRVNTANLLARGEIMVEAAKAQGAAVAQLAAGAMSMLNLNASISGSSNRSQSESYASSRSQSSNCSTNYHITE